MEDKYSNIDHIEKRLFDLEKKVSDWEKNIKAWKLAYKIIIPIIVLLLGLLGWKTYNDIVTKVSSFYINDLNIEDSLIEKFGDKFFIENLKGIEDSLVLPKPIGKYSKIYMSSDYEMETLFISKVSKSSYLGSGESYYISPRQQIDSFKIDILNMKDIENYYFYGQNNYEISLWIRFYDNIYKSKGMILVDFEETLMESPPYPIYFSYNCRNEWPFIKPTFNLPSKTGSYTIRVRAIIQHQSIFYESNVKTFEIEIN